MWSLAHLGHRNEALAQFERLRDLLASELGVAPLESTQVMYEQLLSGEITSPPLTTVILRREPRQVGECPYRGLAAFREQDAPFFYGREQFVSRLKENLRKRSLVAVLVGSSGSGKSSTVFAGLVPELRSEGDWLILNIRPRSAPFKALAAAFLPLLEPDLPKTDQLLQINKLAAALQEGEVLLPQLVARTLETHTSIRRVCLIIDQFEELFTLCPEPDERSHFLDEILSAVTNATGLPEPSFVILLTLRADFMGQALSHRPFADTLQDNAILLGPMNQAELRTAIEKPAEQQGAAFEAGLVARLLDDVGEEPGNLPLLEFALAMLWERLDEGWITHATYEQIGRIDGALARYSDQVYTSLNENAREDAHQVFIQLVQPGQGTEDTRRVATQAEIGSERWKLIQHLADRRLVVTGMDESGQETAELVHEAMIDGWQRLREWMHADRAFRTWQESLRVALRLWEQNDRDEGALLRGAPLAQAQLWRTQQPANLSSVENQFIQASVDLQKQEQAQSEQRRRRTISALAAGLVLALVLVLLVGLQWRRAEDAGELAEIQARIATARELASSALANVELDPQLGLLLALRSIDETYLVDGTILPEAENALHQAVYAANPQQVITDEDELLYHVTYYPDGTQLASWGFSEFPGAVSVWDVNTGDQLFSVPGGGSGISPDGKRLATVVPDLETFNFVFMFWDAVTGELLSKAGVFQNFDMAITSSFTRDWDLIAITYWNGIIEIWDLTLLEQLQTIGFDGRPPDRSIAFSPDGHHLAAGSQDGSLTIWDWDDGQELLRIIAHTSAIRALSYSPDGSLLASASSDGTAKIWEAKSGKQLAVLSGHTNEVCILDFSPSGTLLATAGYDHVVKIWDVEASLNTALGYEILTLIGHQQQVTYLDFSPDENHIASVSEDGTLRIWDITPGSNSEGLVFINGQSPGPAYSVSISLDPNGKRLAAANSDSEPKIWDTTTGQLLHTLSGHNDRVEVIEFSPDGVYVVTASHDKTLKIWDAATGKTLSTIPDIKCGYVDLAMCDLAFSSDGRLLAIGDYEGVAQIFNFQSVLDHDKDTSELNGLVVKAHGENIFSITFSPDGTQFATSSSDGSAKIWDVETGELIHTLSGHEAWVTDISYSPDGKRLATASLDSTAWIWDVATGEWLSTLIGHYATVFRTTFSPDGNLIATASYDGTVKLWDVASSQELITLSGHTSGIADVAFSPDGKRLYTASVDGSIRVFLLDIEELMTLARSRLTRGFTEEECKRFLHMNTCLLESYSGTSE